MLLSATLSKPAKKTNDNPESSYIRVKIKLSVSSNLEQNLYLAEFYTKTQVFHKKMSAVEVAEFIKKNVPANFKNCVERTETEEITVLANKKGEVTRLVKKLKKENALGGGTAPKGVAEGNDNGGTPDPAGERPIPYKNLLTGKSFILTGKSFNKKKNYILPEGKSVPFLVRLGIMTAEGRVIAAKYDKFRQINRFLEIFKDAALEVLAKKGGGELSVVDFGSGKSYLTFAVQYFLTEILKVPCRIFGLDLKKDVIEYCSRLSDELDLKNLSFAVGDIAEFGEDKKPDIIITLHACDTATDYALNYAIKKGASAILSVPCCQHEINLQLKKNKAGENPVFEPLLKYGLIKERFSALVTDAVRGELLENFGYKVQMIEFIDDEGTPKNLMIRAIKKSGLEEEAGAKKSSCKILQELGVSQTLENLLN